MTDSKSAIQPKITEDSPKLLMVAIGVNFVIGTLLSVVQVIIFGSDEQELDRQPKEVEVSQVLSTNKIKDDFGKKGL